MFIIITVYNFKIITRNGHETYRRATDERHLLSGNPRSFPIFGNSGIYFDHGYRIPGFNIFIENDFTS